MGDLTARYPNTAVTGHNTLPVAPMCSVVPTPNGSFLLNFNYTVRCEGLVCESTAMSPGVSMLAVKAPKDGHVNSPECMKPKKPRQKAAHSIVLS